MHKTSSKHHISVWLRATQNPMINVQVVSHSTWYIAIVHSIRYTMTNEGIDLHLVFDLILVW